MPTYGDVIVLQGDDYREFEAMLYPRSSDEDLANGILLGSPDVKSAFQYLMQWEYGEGVEERDTPGWGGSDSTAAFDAAGRRLTRHAPTVMSRGYVMSWHTGLSYASLTRVTTVD